ncbi:MAG: HU family DNA-binding protein [Selenomonadaceae bacterium]|nr:HU family DNA-binding protein [Selenomonadaceae bacterium]MBQ7723241.1 HU family DNA-binding protein [Selenomonadaceae bacterium]
MTRAELIVKVAEKANIDRKSAERAVASTFEIIKGALIADEKVQILGFGTFENRMRAARKGRNPRTGEEIEIEASKLPSFKAGKSLKEACNS